MGVGGEFAGFLKSRTQDKSNCIEKNNILI